MYAKLLDIAINEFSDIVVNAEILFLATGDQHKLRLDIIDGSLLDVYLSISGKYSYHWERRLISAGDLYRHDNAPHQRWSGVATFPKHFHDGNEENVVASHLSSIPEEALREFLKFARDKLFES